VGRYKRGYLKKKGGYRAGKEWLEHGSRHAPGIAWKWRWFVLAPHYIAYYKGLSSSKPSYLLSLVNISDIEIDVMGEEGTGARGSGGGGGTHRSGLATARSMGGADDEPMRSGFSFALLTPDTRIEILCADLQERSDWLVALKACIDRMVKEATERSITAGIALRRSNKGAAKTVANGSGPGGGASDKGAATFSKRGGLSREPTRP